jgi:sec-independent protein translocase protein TatC
MQDKPDPPIAPGTPPGPPDPAGLPEGHDEVEASKAPLLDHLIELRTRLIHALIGVGAGFVLCFYFATQIYNLLVWPYQVARGPGQRVDMIFTAPHEFLFTKLKLALFGAVFLAFPLIALEIYKFVAPGLYKNERAAFRPYLLATFFLFILGALVVYFIVMPMAMIFFLSMEQTGGDVQIQLQARVSEYLSLIMTLILGFGIMFQLPVVLTLLARAGIVGGAQLRQFRRYAIVAITGLAAVLSPPDPFSMLAMALPTILLYEGAILAVDRVEKARLAREAAEQAQAPAS